VIAGEESSSLQSLGNLGTGWSTDCDWNSLAVGDQGLHWRGRTDHHQVAVRFGTQVRDKLSPRGLAVAPC
jgi:hypothetical protein